MISWNDTVAADRTRATLTLFPHQHQESLGSEEETEMGKQKTRLSALIFGSN